MLFAKEKNESQSLCPIRLSELLLTRFTHDIAGPISAVSNGLDFLMNDAKDAEDPGAVEIRNQAVDLVEESAKQSLARLQAYRVAYGVVYNEAAETQVKEITDILKRFFHKSQVEVRFGTSIPETISAIKRRILLGMVLTISRILIYGGKINVSIGGEKKRQLIVRASAEKYKEPALINDILTDKTNVEPDVENVPYFFIRETCKKSGVKISFKYGDENGAKMVEFITEFAS